MLIGAGLVEVISRVMNPEMRFSRAQRTAFRCDAIIRVYEWRQRDRAARSRGRFQRVVAPGTLSLVSKRFAVKICSLRAGRSPSGSAMPAAADQDLSGRVPDDVKPGIARSASRTRPFVSAQISLHRVKTRERRFLFDT